MININIAPAEELERLKGIGEHLALQIVKDRAEHGPFTSADDLTRISGISKRIVDENRQIITVKAPLLLSHDPSLDREAERIAVRQAWLDKLKALASFSETTAMIDGWFEDLKQRKAEAREELSGLKESQAILSREWQ